MEHYCELLSLTDISEINYYINNCIKNNLSVRQLRNKIKSKEYERLSESAKSKFITNEESLLPDLVKNPILIKNTNKYNEISEKVLQQIILEDIDSFMKESGNGFSYISNEKGAPLEHQLSWSQYVELLPIKDKNKLLYYYINKQILML